MPVLKSLAVQSKCNSLRYPFSGPKTAVSQTRFAEQAVFAQGAESMGPITLQPAGIEVELLPTPPSSNCSGYSPRDCVRAIASPTSSKIGRLSASSSRPLSGSMPGPARIVAS